jgi:glycerol-3-phosphate dehydrogenase (NAD(P)+)
MAKICILGAGYMGSAVSFPLRENGHSVRIWGTWLDDALIQGARAGFHPRLKKPLPEGVGLFQSTQLEEALDGVDAIFFGIASEGFAPVFKRLLPLLDRSIPIFSLTKGFISISDRYVRTSEAASIMSSKVLHGALLWTSIGGPVKAVELSDGIPTASLYATREPSLTGMIRSFGTPTYRTIPESDIVGLELCASLKNAYAILLGICDGLFKNSDGRLFDNIKALFLSMSVAELAGFVEAAGGHRQTVYGLAGMGDLHVTAQSGRNRKFGEMLGSGVPASRAYQDMFSAGEIAEGYHAVLHGYEYAQAIDPSLPSSLPILSLLRTIMLDGCIVRDAVLNLVEEYPSINLCR